MRDWFKARNIWGAAIQALSDAEAGRLMKAVWAYTMTGEQQELSGAEKGVYALILMTLSQDEEHNTEVSSKRAMAGAMGGKQKVANLANATFASEDVANEANAFNKSKSKNKSKEKDKDNYKDDVSGEPSSPPVAQIPLNDGSMFDITEEFTAEMEKLYPAVDVRQEYRNMIGWCVGNPSRRKTRSGIRRFITSWLGREQDKGKVVQVKKVNPAQQFQQREYAPDTESLSEMLDRLGGKK